MAWDMLGLRGKNGELPAGLEVDAPPPPEAADGQLVKEEEAEDYIVVLEDEDGNESMYVLLFSLEIDSLRYAVLIPLSYKHESDLFNICVYSIDADGHEIYSDIEDAEQYKKVLAAVTVRLQAISNDDTT